MGMARLTNKRKAFIEEYLQCWNASEAARRVGYKKPGQYGHYLKNLEIVQAEIRRRIADKAMSADEVLHRLGEHARGDIAEFITDTGAIDWQAVKVKGRLIQRITHRKGEHSSIDLYSAQNALVTLAKHFKLTPERYKHEVTVRAEDLTDDELAVIAAGGGSGAD